MLLLVVLLYRLRGLLRLVLVPHCLLPPLLVVRLHTSLLHHLPQLFLLVELHSSLAIEQFLLLSS